MPSRVEKNYSSNKVNKRTVKNQDLYKSFIDTEYRVISSNYLNVQEEEVHEEEKLEVPSVLKTDRLSSFIMEEEKERDINKVLKQAKSNRNREDDLEKKRKLDKKEYNITKKINVDDEEAVSKFRNQNKKVVENEEELSDLINTIYSKKDSDNLLDNLMPSSLEETIVTDEKIEESIKEAKENKKIENSFFTSSIELSEDDLEEINGEEEEDIFFDDCDKSSFGKVVFTVVSTIIFILLLVFVIYKYFLKV